MNQELIKEDTLENSIKSKWGYALLACLSVLLLTLPFALEKAELFAIPLVIVGGSLFLFYRKLLFVVLCVSLPLSHELPVPGLKMNMSLPGELMIGLMAIWGVYAMIFTSKDTSALLKHPITWLVVLFWVSCGISTLASTMPSVSIKTFVLLSAYLVVFYFLVFRFVIRSEIEVLKPYIWYCFLLFGLAIYATYLHSNYMFDKNVAGFVVKPFFSDHTIYGACLAFVLPITFGLYYYSKQLSISYPFKIFWLLCTIVFLVAVFFSHSRASWMSLVAAMLFYFILKLKIRFRTLMIAFISVVFIFILFIDQLAPAFFKNKNDSKAKGANIEEQLKSVTNMKKDVSNAERVNRWLCAFRMFENKPITGYGAGTFQYQYLPFQRSSEMTIISVTSAKVKHLQGFGGTAHSEYLLALSEMGILGGGAIFLMIFVVIRSGMNVYYTAKDKVTSISAMLVTLAMVTYFVHGFFNNFLTTDKAGFLFWTGCALIVALEVKSRINQPKNSPVNL
jgi:putative inorganic carbon (HCO3(-)) transporter